MPVLSLKTHTYAGAVVALPYVEYWQNILYLNDSFMETMRARNDYCNYTSYLETYLTFPPPPGPFPVLPDPYATDSYTCDVFGDFVSAILKVNPCFNIYHITETCLILIVNLEKSTQATMYLRVQLFTSTGLTFRRRSMLRWAPTGCNVSGISTYLVLLPTINRLVIHLRVQHKTEFSSA